MTIATLPLVGMNISGMASNDYVENAELGTHYREPEDKHFIATPCELFRMPTSANRFSQGQGIAINEAYCLQVEKVLDRAASHGKKVILELHNYMRLPVKVQEKAGPYTFVSWYQVKDANGVVYNYRDQSFWSYQIKPGYGYAYHFDKRDGKCRLYEYRVIGVAGNPKLYNQYGMPDLWKRIVKRFMNHPAIFGWGIMNEPYSNGEIDPSTGQLIDMKALWHKTAYDVVESIWPIDKNHFVFVCGNEYASARNWPIVSDMLKDLPDPYGMLVYEAHNYLDNKGTGGGNWNTSAGVNEIVDPNTGINMVTPFVDWLVANGKKGYLGEHGFPAGNLSAKQATDALLDHLIGKRIPSTQWCFGPGWPDDDQLGMCLDRNLNTVPLKDNCDAIMTRIGVKTEKYGPV